MANAPPKKSKRKLRSEGWFNSGGRDDFVHRSWMKNQGLPHDLFDWQAGDRHLQYLVAR